MRLRANSPAATSRTSDTAICVTTSMRRRRTRAGPCAGPPVDFSAGSGSIPAGAQRRREPEHERGEDGDNQREGQDAQVRPGIDRQRQGTRRHRRQGRTRPSREQQSRNAAGRGKEQRLGERLADDAHAPGADGQADGGFAAPCFCARQHQVGDIRAGNDQHEPDQAHQDHERRRQVAAQRSRTRSRASAITSRLSSTLFLNSGSPCRSPLLPAPGRSSTRAACAPARE